MMENTSHSTVMGHYNVTERDPIYGGPSYTVRITVVIMLSIFSVVGLIGNAIAFYIFFRRRATSTSVIFILALAGTDLFTCLVTIPYTVVFELLSYTLVYDLACKTYMFLITSTLPFSAYIMVGIALDRYFCICHPFLYVFTIPRAKAVIFCMGIPAFTFGVITALTYGTYAYDLEYYTTEKNISTVMKFFGLTEKDVITEDYLSKHEILQPNQRFIVLNNTMNYTVRSVVKHYSICVNNNFIFSSGFLEVYKKIHALNFLLAYVSVAILYILIYKSIFTRRANKARRKKNNLYPTSGDKVKGQQSEETQMTVIASCDHHNSRFMNNQTRKDAKCARKITLTARNDPNAFNNLGTRKSSGSATADAQEDERTNLLANRDEGNRQNSHFNTESNATASNKCTTDCQDKESCVYIGPVPTNAALHQSPRCAPSVDNKEKDDMKDSHISNNTTHERDDVKKDEIMASPDVHDDDVSPCIICQDGQAPEEKPLLSQSPPLAQCPASPPTTLSLKANSPAVKSSQEDNKTDKKSNQSDTQESSLKRKRPSTVRDRNLMANIKTAFMLFIVTIIFIIAFLPALLMANDLIPLNLIVFYGYFIYNVANPFIYAFMNQTFREDLKKLMHVCQR